jgi:hypothetical protein
MASQSFRKRILEVSVKMAANPQTNQPGTFNESGTNTATFSGLRTVARIENSGGFSGSKASIDVYGISPSLMNQMATLGMVYNIVEKNTLTLQAGDDQAGVATVFSGTIVAAYADLNSAPDVPFHFECNAGVGNLVAPSPATSYAGATSVETIMTAIARQMGVTFENSGVNVSLRNPYYAGTYLQQMQAVAQDANINAQLINGQTLAIWPKGGSRNTPTPTTISAQTGMVGYPSFTQNGIMLKTLFKPEITFGSLIKVESIVIDAAQQSKSAPVSTVLPANGVWAITKLDHNLDSDVPRGQWLSMIQAYNPKYPRPIVAGPRG